LTFQLLLDLDQHLVDGDVEVKQFLGVGELLTLDFIALNLLLVLPQQINAYTNTPNDFL